jgi:hypothetical protein
MALFCNWSREAVRSVFARLGTINEKLEKVMATLADLQAAVAATTAVEESAIVLIEGIAQQLKDALANSDPAAVQAVIDSLDAEKAKLAAAVAANTPAA